MHGILRADIRSAEAKVGMKRHEEGMDDLRRFAFHIKCVRHDRRTIGYVVIPADRCCISRALKFENDKF